MTKTTLLATLPQGTLNTDALETGLDKITQDKKRRAQAHTVFDAHVNEAVPAHVAMELAFRKAASGLKQEQTKVVQALEATRIYPGQPTAPYTNGVQTTDRDGLKWRIYPSRETSHWAVVGALVGLAITVLVIVLCSPWLLSIYTKSPNQGLTTTCILLFVICFVLFGILLGWVIGSGRFTTTNQTTSSETSTTSTTTTA
jgi:hypothetical protein